MTDNDRTVRPFADFLREQNKGNTHDELSAALNDLTSAVHAHGKAGTLVFTLKVEPMKDNADVLMVSDKIEVKPPRAKRKASVFFPDADGNLRRNDPRQMTFDGLRQVEETTGEILPDAAKRAAGDK